MKPGGPARKSFFHSCYRKQSDTQIEIGVLVAVAVFVCQVMIVLLRGSSHVCVSLLSDAWYKRSEQENAGGIWKSRVFMFLCVCVRAFVCPLSLCLQFEVNRLVCIQLLSLSVPKTRFS